MGIAMLLLAVSCSNSQVQVDDVEAATQLLEQERNQVKEALSAGEEAKPLIQRLLELGLWEEAQAAMENNPNLSAEDKSLLQVQYLWLNNQFKAAEVLVDQLLQENPEGLEARQFKATLLIESWKLKEAEDLCKALLQEDGSQVETQVILGRALLLQKKYPEALELAKQLQADYPKFGKGYQLEADVYFWDKQPEKAEPLLLRSLELNPFDADARFSYGYAIWRRIDATQLDDMAAQWELALALNPLHFSTHWHWGNGHTNLTYADYADPDETAIREALDPADALFSAGKLEEARDLVHKVQQDYPESLIPMLYEASFLYSDFESDQRAEELDEAQDIFVEMLKKKPHYGPAHNGLSAVIKSKRIPYLSFYDSLTNVLENVEIQNPELFKQVFPDMAYYPGNRVQEMVWNQLYASVVYFPFLAKQGRTFVIPPLHKDLAIAMNRPSFRFTTTFDNRQWMDIRGVGSGAADIGYTERGAYFERNVVLHEYVHLFHGRVLTDKENRRVRALYYNAMEHNQTMDYYSQNNESEYFAQTYPAFFEPMKVHPLDFKSMNTTHDLKTKDPEMYAFLDSLVQKQQAYLAGDQEVMASNWAQVYLNMSAVESDKNPALAARYLDTALRYDVNYQPAYIAYAGLKQAAGDFDAAEALLKQAETIDDTYAPVYTGYADLLQARYLQDTQLDVKEAQVDFIKKAIALEGDYQTAADMHRQLRSLLFDYGDMDAAIAAADDYGSNGPEVSTYLRDRKDDARAYAATYRAYQGDNSGMEDFKYLISQKPQNYTLRALYSDALQALGQYDASIANMEEAQRILGSSGGARTDFKLRIAEAQLAKGQLDASTLDAIVADVEALDPLLKLRLIQVLLSTDRLQDAKTIWADLDAVGMPYYVQQYQNLSSQLNQ